MHVSSRVRKVAILATAAAVASASLLTAAVPARATVPFQITAVNAPKTVGIPASATDLSVTLTFSGDPASDQLEYHDYSSTLQDARITYVGGQVPASAAIKPWFAGSSGEMVPGKPVTYKFSFDSDVTPGKYQISLPVSQINYATNPTTKVDRWATAYINVMANPNVTLTGSYIQGSGTFSKKSKWKWYFSGPSYLAYAKVTLYYKANGKKKYTKIATAKLNKQGKASFKSKKGAIRKTGTIYIAIGAVPYAAAVKSGAIKIVRR